MIFIDNEIARVDQLGMQAQKEVDILKVKYEKALMVLNEHQTTRRYLAKLKVIKGKYLRADFDPRKGKVKKNFRKKALKKLGTAKTILVPSDKKTQGPPHLPIRDGETGRENFDRTIQALNASEGNRIVLPRGVDPNNAEEVEQALMDSANKETDEEILDALTKMANGEEEAIHLTEKMREWMAEDGVNPNSQEEVKAYLEDSKRGLHKAEGE